MENPVENNSAKVSMVDIKVILDIEEKSITVKRYNPISKVFETTVEHYFLTETDNDDRTSFYILDTKSYNTKIIGFNMSQSKISFLDDEKFVVLNYNNFDIQKK